MFGFNHDYNVPHLLINYPELSVHINSFEKSKYLKFLQFILEQKLETN